MSVFKTEIEDLVGVVGDDTFLNDSIVSTAKEIIKALPPTKVFSVSETSAEITSQAYDIGEAKVLKVQRETGSDGVYANCTEISVEYEDKVQDSGSMFYPSVTNPVYLFKNGNVWVYPAPENSPNSMKVTTVLYPTTIDCTSASVGSGLATFPNEYENLVVVGAATKALQYLMARVKDNFSGINPTFVAPTMGSVGSLTLPSVPTAPSISSNSVSFSTTAPAYTKPVLSLTSFPSITWALPSVPPVPVLTSSTVSFSQTAPTYAKPVLSFTNFPTLTWTFPSVPVVPTLTSSTVSFSQTAPTYAKPVISLTTFPTLTWGFPTPPVAPVLQTTTISFSQTAPTYVKPVFSEPGFPTINGMTLPGVPNAPVEPSFTTPDIVDGTVGSLGTAPTYAKPVQSFDIGQLETFLETNEDPELAQVQIGRLSQELGQYQADIQNELNEFNKENAIYQTTVQEAIKNAEIKAQENQGEANLKLSKEQQEYGAKLSKFQNDIGNYQAQVNKEVQRWTAEEYNKKFQEWQTKYNNRLQGYSSDIQNALNLFNKENVEYQAQLQVSIQNAQQEGSDDAQILQKYQNQVSSYQSEVGKVVQGNQGQASEWQAQNNLKLQQYGSDIQNELNEFNKENAIYEAQLQISIQNAQLDSTDDGQLIQKYQNELGSYQAEVTKVVEGNGGQISEWNIQNTLKLQQYSTDVQNELNEFNKENVIYQAELQVSIQNAQLNSEDDSQLIQKYQNELGSYQAEVTKVVQGNQGQVSEWNIQNKINLEQYSVDIQNELNDFNKESAEYQAQLQISIQNAQLSSEGDAQTLQKYNGQIGAYQAEVASAIQKWTAEEWTQNFEKYNSDYARIVEKFNADVQKYGADLQKYNSEYQWYQDQYARLSADYKEQLQIIMAN